MVSKTCLVERRRVYFFRHEYSRLVAVFTRRLGTQHLLAIEDAVQSALLAAVESWPLSDVPREPGAWLYRVASNQLVDEFRKKAHHDGLGPVHRQVFDLPGRAPSARLGGELGDDLLNMLFVCCNPSIPAQSQLVLALKTLCGFGANEIAERLFISEANVYKRLGRAKVQLRAEDELDVISNGELSRRLPAVQLVVYTLFTEGYLSSHAEGALRGDLCDEAIRLGSWLSTHPLTATPETHALLALMLLHAARTSGRQAVDGGLLLLQDQDRSLWDNNQIAQGLIWLARSAEGEHFSRFHAEAGIAAEHCLAPTFAETRWDRIVSCYELLERVAPSALHTLNRAVAIAEWQGATSALAVLDGLDAPSWLVASYQWSAVLADLYGRTGHAALANRYREAALEGAPSVAIREALARRLQSECK
jgi:RNA polymerase sigma-70 factor (ECF subfamily)